MKKSIKFVIIIALVIIAVSVYLFGVNAVKRLVGYDVSVPKKDNVGDRQLSYLTLPEGFGIEIFTEGLDGPRVLVFDPEGDIIISETKRGRVTLLEDQDKDGMAENKKTLLANLNNPHGLAFHTDARGTTYIYVAESDEVVRYIYNSRENSIQESTRQNIANIPDAGLHFTRTIAFGPNYRSGPIINALREKETQNPDKLYISVGSSCDACIEDSWKRAAILESDPKGSFTAEFAGGLRNAVFFTFHPKTKEIWATEMGRDNLGDNLPPDEINIVRVAGEEHKFGARRYGWPFCYGSRIKDRLFNPGSFQRKDISSDCTKTELPAIEIQAHSAPLGLAFIPSNVGWPKEWEGDLLVSLHGSSNRSDPIGYKVVRYDLDKNGNVLSQKPIDFINGWLSKSKIFGRPVDLKFNSDGSLYITDDSAGLVYRVKPRI